MMSTQDGLKSKIFYLDEADSALLVFRAFNIVDDLVYLGNTIDTIAGGGINVLNGLNATSQFFATTDLDISSVGNTHTFNLNTVSIAKGGTGQTTANSALNALLPSQGGNAGKFLKTDGTNTSWSLETDLGTVTSVAVSGTDFTISGSPITTSGTINLTLATVNGNVGTFGSATQVGTFTVNGKGLITAASNVTVTPAASSITGGQAITKTDDTNVTLTLGGTPSTALLSAASLTLGWTGTLSGARGGTGVNNSGKTITLDGNLTTSGANALIFTTTGATNVTLPTSGTLLTSATAYINGGNSFGGAATIGTNDNFKLSVKTNNVNIVDFNTNGDIAALSGNITLITDKYLKVNGFNGIGYSTVAGLTVGDATTTTSVVGDTESIVVGGGLNTYLAASHAFYDSLAATNFIANLDISGLSVIGDGLGTVLGHGAFGTTTVSAATVLSATDTFRGTTNATRSAFIETVTDAHTNGAVTLRGNVLTLTHSAIHSIGAVPAHKLQGNITTLTAGTDGSFATGTFFGHQTQLKSNTDQVGNITDVFYHQSLAPTFPTVTKSGTATSTGTAVAGTNTVFDTIVVAKTGTATTTGTAVVGTGTAFATVVAKTGTASSLSVFVTGTGTLFTTEFAVGDTISAAGQARIIAFITDDTHLITTSVFSPVLSGAAVSKVVPNEFAVGDLIAIGDGASPTQVRVISLITDSTHLTVSTAFSPNLTAKPVTRATTIMTGTATTTGTSVAGTGTLFTTEFANGDQIFLNGQLRIIGVIFDDLTLITTLAFSPDVTNAVVNKFQPPQFAIGGKISLSGQIRTIATITSSTALTVTSTFSPDVAGVAVVRITAPDSITGYDIKNLGVSGITTNTAINIAAQSGATNNYAIASAAGNLHGFGTTAPTQAVDVSGNIQLKTVGNKFLVKEGSGGFMGQVALVAGTKAISITGVTTSTRAFITLVIPNTTALTTTYQAVCTANTLTIQANVAAGTINVADISTLNYFLIEPAP